jgi:hypothetical protein
VAVAVRAFVALGFTARSAYLRGFYDFGCVHAVSFLPCGMVRYRIRNAHSES